MIIKPTQAPKVKHKNPELKTEESKNAETQTEIYL